MFFLLLSFAPMSKSHVISRFDFCWFHVVFFLAHIGYVIQVYRISYLHVILSIRFLNPNAWITISLCVFILFWKSKKKLFPGILLILFIRFSSSSIAFGWLVFKVVSFSCSNSHWTNNHIENDMKMKKK